MDTCRLCSELFAPSPGAIWNTPLFESPNFVAIPSLGSLVEGWQLLVPKTHFLSMGALSRELAVELHDVKREIIASLLRRYQRLAIFEHGPSSPNGSVGCSVDHAHLHFVPIDFDLLEAAKPFLPTGTIWSRATWEDCRDAYVNGNDYLYLEQPHGPAQIALGSSFGSQIFRRAIAARIGVPEQFNWRQHPNVENIARTIQSATLAREGAMSL